LICDFYFEIFQFILTNSVGHAPIDRFPSSKKSGQGRFAELRSVKIPLVLLFAKGNVKPPALMRFKGTHFGATVIVTRSLHAG
jgi:hypothetical protein